MDTTTSPTALEASERLEADALAAAEEHDAALAAQQAEARYERLADAEMALHHAMRAVIGPDAYFEVIGHLDLDGFGPGGFAARTRAGGLTFMVERPDNLTATNVELLAPCPDCGLETPYGSHLASLTELGYAIRQAKLPCAPCARGASTLEVTPAKKPWVIGKHGTPAEAEAAAAALEVEGYEVNVFPVGGGEYPVGYVVAGHHFDARSW